MFLSKKVIPFIVLVFFLASSTFAKGWNTIDLNKENATYEIKEDYDLGGKTMTIPAGCTLKFNGGIIRNGCLKGNGTKIEANHRQIFSVNLHLVGSWSFDAWLPEWFGNKGGNGQLDTKAIQCALDAARDTEMKVVKLQGKTYFIDATLNVYPYTSLIGSEQSASWLYATQIIPCSSLKKWTQKIF